MHGQMRCFTVVGFLVLQSELTSSRTSTWEKVDYLWVDTCCIDKSSSAELSEAINSMYSWYYGSKRCIVYLSDVYCRALDDHSPVDMTSEFIRGRWFTRGWTLQELLSPSNLVFYNRNWEVIGFKRYLAYTLAAATNIPALVFLNSQFHRTELAEQTQLAQQISWAANRRTTRGEDAAYCLLGIFDVNMPLLYGEGERHAFERLQRQILAQTEDSTLLAWGYQIENSEHSLLASSPREYKNCTNVSMLSEDAAGSFRSFQMTNRGLQVSLDLCRTPANQWGAGTWYALLPCQDRIIAGSQLALILLPVSTDPTRLNSHDAHSEPYLMRRIGVTILKRHPSIPVHIPSCAMILKGASRRLKPYYNLCKIYNHEELGLACTEVYPF